MIDGMAPVARKRLRLRQVWKAIQPNLPIWVLLLVVLLAAAPLWGPGIVNTRGGGDSPFLLQRAHQMAKSLRAGVFPVRWMPDAAYGLGYPFFNHYSALPFYLSAILNLLGLDLLMALKLTQTLGFLLAALAMYGWVYHLWRHRPAAFLAAVAYTVAPFHLVNVYVRGDSLSEFFAFLFFPLILWSMTRLAERSAQDRYDWIANLLLVALSYAGLILTHNISAFMFTPFVLLYLAFLVRGDWKRRSDAIALSLVGLLAGMALAAWAWLPALLERGYVQSDTLTLGYFNFANHFRASNLVQPALLFDYSIAVSLGGASPFAMGSVQALLTVIGGIFLVYWTAIGGTPTGARRASSDPGGRSADQRWVFIYVVLGLLLATFLVTPISRPLWEHVPLLGNVQFPWRFLSIQAFFAAVATSALALRFAGWRSWLVSGVVAALLALSALWSLHPERLPIAPEDVIDTRLQEYELFTSNIGTTIRWEWLPEAAVPRPFTSDYVIEPQQPARPLPLDGSLVVAQQTQRRPVEQTWQLQTGDTGASLAFPLLYWPGWRARVDGEPAPVWAVEGAGYLALDVPPGTHTVHLELGRTPLRAAAEALSMVGSVSVLMLLVWRVIHPQARVAFGVINLIRYVVRGALYGAPFLAALLLLGGLSRTPPYGRDDLTMDFVAMPYLHHNPGGVIFSGVPGQPAGRLLSYSLSNDQLAPGDELIASIMWDEIQEGGDDRQVRLRMVSPAEHLPDLKSGPYALAEDTVPLEESTVLRLRVPGEAPRGVYLLQLELSGPAGVFAALTPSGNRRGPLYLRPVRVVVGAPVVSDEAILAQAGPDIRLHAAQLTQMATASDASTLTVWLEWSAVRRIAANYKISVRLLDPEGNRRVAVDTQPGYGFAPTSLWRPDKRVGDRYNLRLPDDLVDRGGYRLLLVFYRAPMGPEVARAVLGPFSLPLDSPFVSEPPTRLFELPQMPHPLSVDLSDSARGDHIRLAGYDLALETESLDVTLWWEAQRQPSTDYKVFVHLFDATDETAIVTQYDGMPRQGAYPTSRWLAGEIVSDTVRLSLTAVRPGLYGLAVGLYDEATGDRLVVTGPEGDRRPGGRWMLLKEIRVPRE